MDAYPVPRLKWQDQYCAVCVEILLKGVLASAIDRQGKTGVCMLYRCQVLPFGMNNVPATFQRLMNFVTSG